VNKLINDDVNYKIAELDPVQVKNVEYAGFLIRLLGFFIDQATLFVIYLITILIPFILFSMYFKNVNSSYSGLYGTISYVLESWLYESIFLSSEYMATPGKMLLKLKVTDVNGNRITFLRATVRYIFKDASFAVHLNNTLPVNGILFIGTFFIGLLSIINSISPFFIPFTEKKQALHDKIADTIVIYDQ
jgi:uncharacterized RDD family membrane protein YckC